MVYKYSDDFEKGMLANANAGGDNVALGSILGAILGATHGIDKFPEWAHELHEKDEILKEIDDYLNLFRKF